MPLVLLVVKYNDRYEQSIWWFIFYYERSVIPMGKRDRKCYLCGESYKYCPTCSQDRIKPSWMTEFHSEDCKNIFDICTRFNLQMISKTEAKKELNSCDLSNKEKFKSYVQHDLEVIFAEEPKKRGKRAELNIIDEVADIKPVFIDDTLHEVVKQEDE